MLVEPREIPSRQVPERLPRLARQRQQPRSARGRLLLLRRLRQRDRDRRRRPGGQGFRCVGADGLAVALQDEVCVRAGPPEPAHACSWRTTGNDRPLGRLRRHPHREPLPVDLRVRGVEVQVLRDDPVLHRQHHLDETGCPCCRFQVPDVRLHRPDEQRTVGVASPAVHRPRGLHLDRVAHRRSRPVRLNVVHFPRFESRLEQRRLDHLLLGRLARHRQPRTRPVLVQRRCPDDAPYPVAVRLRLAQPLQHQDAAAFAPNVAVRRGIERFALPVGGQHPRVRAQLQQSAGQDRVYPSRQRQVRLAALQAGDRLVDGHERR